MAAVEEMPRPLPDARSDYLPIALLLVILGVILSAWYFASSYCPPPPTCNAPPGYACSAPACPFPNPFLLELGLSSASLGLIIGLRSLVRSRLSPVSGTSRETFQAIRDARTSAVFWAASYVPLLPLIFQVQYTAWGYLINQTSVSFAVLFAFVSLVMGLLSASGRARAVRASFRTATGRSVPPWPRHAPAQRWAMVQKSVTLAFFLALGLSLFWGFVAAPYSTCDHCPGPTTDELRSWAATVGGLNILAAGLLFARTWLSFQMLRDLVVRDAGSRATQRTARSDWILTIGAGLTPFNPFYLMGFLFIVSPSPSSAMTYEALFLPGLVGAIVVVVGLSDLLHLVSLPREGPPLAGNPATVKV